MIADPGGAGISSLFVLNILKIQIFLPASFETPPNLSTVIGILSEKIAKASESSARRRVHAQPYLDGWKVVCCQLVEASCNAPTPFDLVEKPLDQIAGAVAIRSADHRSSSGSAPIKALV
jgi:hypothetical protein